MMRSLFVGRVSLYALAIALVATSAMGCKSKREPVVEPAFDTSGQTTYEQTTGTGLPDIDIENLLFSKDSGLRTVYFDFDSSALRPDAIRDLNFNADLLKQAPNAIIQIEGHTDERGTQEYNLALGERRAQSVREYLVRVGVSGNRLITISYGEEAPAVLGSNESAWSRNRRAEFSRALP